MSFSYGPHIPALIKGFPYNQDINSDINSKDALLTPLLILATAIVFALRLFYESGVQHSLSTLFKHLFTLNKHLLAFNHSFSLKPPFSKCGYIAVHHLIHHPLNPTRPTESVYPEYHGNQTPYQRRLLFGSPTRLTCRLLCSPRDPSLNTQSMTTQHMRKKETGNQKVR